MTNFSHSALTSYDLLGHEIVQDSEAVSSGPYLVSYDPIPVRRSTFLAGLSENVHSWFRLTPSFGPDLVRTIIKQMNLAPHSHIHDPFSGAGTTAIEASLEGYEASCVEVNPFLYFVGKTSIDWSINADDAAAQLESIKNKYYSMSATATLDNIADLGIDIPKIHNIHRWWRNDVLKDILVLKSSIRSCTQDKYCSFFELALAAVLVPDLTNVTLGKLQLHFVNKDDKEINVWPTYESHAKKMIHDLSLINKQNFEFLPKIIYGDSTQKSTFSEVAGIDAIITSPPYPNRYSYIWNTRPHLYILDMISEAKEASQIDRRTIGGTWGTATSELGKGIFSPINAVVKDALEGVHERIAGSDQLMANYVTHYFNRLFLHIEAIKPSLNPKAKLAYVVGNSWIKGEYVATDVILAKIIEGALPGSSIDGLHRFRRRNSGKNLFETIVYSTLPV
uniref:site-specific DNA-methyltransferase (cytosine-N(4)-specific) n=1 Tax=Planococcus citreus TaxID=1373 RepID=K4LA26_9BACL|nr:M.PciI [Planococcus citreus]